VKWPHWWFTYTAGAAERVVAAGFPAERVTVVQNSIDTSTYESASASPRVPGTCVFLGSLHEHKRIRFLLEAGEAAHQRSKAFRLMVVGDGPMRHLVQETSARTSWLRYLGPLFGEDKARAVQNAELMLIPGLVGLAVIDSFAGATPIVTTGIPYHSPEFEYLSAGENAYVLPGTVDSTEYADAVIELLKDAQLLAALRDGCRASATRYSLKAMVDNFATGVLISLDTPR
jgi:glycosyltransferase involved in cell wall biosynthesis